MCQVYSVFDFSVGKIVGMTGGDFSPAGSIQYLMSMRKRLYDWLA